MKDIVFIGRGDSLSQQVYDQLRMSLIRGAFKPGEQLTIRTLAKHMNVSPTPAREALNRLAAEGALEFGANRNLFVPVLTEARLREIFAIRSPLEEQLVRAAFPHLTAEHVQALEKYLQAREDLDVLDPSQLGRALALNMEFSFIIFREAQRPITLKIIEGLWLLAGPNMNLFYPELAMDRWGLRLHRAQLDAIRAGDLERCLDYMKQEEPLALDLISRKLSRIQSAERTA